MKRNLAGIGEEWLDDIAETKIKFFLVHHSPWIASDKDKKKGYITFRDNGELEKMESCYSWMNDKQRR